MSWFKNSSPVGWYVGSYLVRFVEIADPAKDDPEARFLSWENTMRIKAEDLDEAYEKALKIGMDHMASCKGGEKNIDVQWIFEGVTQILPVNDEIEDGEEILWTERSPRKLKKQRELARGRGQFRQ